VRRFAGAAADRTVGGQVIAPRTLRARLAATLAALLIAGAAHGSATITVINADGLGEGFNDQTHVAPVGGNPGTTLGQQRWNVVQQAASIWGALITSPEPILIQVGFNPMSCTATSAVLGAAGPRFVEYGDPNFEFQHVWYHEALANKQAGTDLTPPFATDNGSDINAQFNSSIGLVGCLQASSWYYGYDHNEGSKIDLLAVVLHEFAHGLGFSTVTNAATGEFFTGPPTLPALFDHFLYDETSALHWDEMTPEQRVASAVNTGNLSWDGVAVNGVAPWTMAHAPELGVSFGAGHIDGSAGSFGSPLALDGVTGQAVVVVDPTAPANDGCETPFANAGALAGKIAVMDRGLCTFTLKAANAQAAGAIGCVFVNNTSGAFSPSGTDPSVTIPVIAVSQADGVALKAAIAAGPTPVTLRLSTTQVAGLTPSGRLRMYAPNPLVPGGSVSHWDPAAAPNLLMEPALNSDLTSDVDLTKQLFSDIGWLPHGTGVTPAGPAARVTLAARPNPAHGALAVHFDLPRDETVELALYDLTGRRVRTLAKGACAAGPHDVAWDGRDSFGHEAGPGVYLARLNGSRTQVTQHIVLVR
jgi:hypothetical protein